MPFSIFGNTNNDVVFGDLPRPEEDYSPDPMANGTGSCWTCGEPEGAHCDVCSACPDQHAGWCSKDQEE